MILSSHATNNVKGSLPANTQDDGEKMPIEPSNFSFSVRIPGLRVITIWNSGLASLRRVLPCQVLMQLKDI